MFSKILTFNRVTSTQDVARRLIGQREEIAVAAQAQTRGRGRQKRLWFSPRGGLYVSFLVFPRRHLASLPLAAARSVIRILEHFGFARVSIHWPNDILLDNRKVCGILCEQVRSAVICGIGLNVNTRRFPRSVPNSISLSLAAGREFDTDQVLRALVTAFSLDYRNLQDGGLDIQDIRPYLSGLGESVEVRTRRGAVTGTVFDIDNDWALLLADHAGRIHKFLCGDVRRLTW